MSIEPRYRETPPRWIDKFDPSQEEFAGNCPVDEDDTDPSPAEHDPEAVDQLAAVLHEAGRRAWVEYGAAASGAGLGWPWEDLEESQREPVRFRARCLLDQFDLISKG